MEKVNKFKDGNWYQCCKRKKKKGQFSSVI